jgi:SAM-dependent methyltransferase
MNNTTEFYNKNHLLMSELEKNIKHETLNRVILEIITSYIETVRNKVIKNYKIASLGAGALSFTTELKGLLKKNTTIDWVEPSKMLDLAKINIPIELQKKIYFIKSDITEYFINNIIPLDIIYSVRTIDHHPNLNELSESLYNNLNPKGLFIGDITASKEDFILTGGNNKKMRFVYSDGTPIPEGKSYTPKISEPYGIQFINPKYVELTKEERLKVSIDDLWMNPPVEKHYYNPKYIEEAFSNNGFNTIVVNMKNLIEINLKKIGIEINMDYEVIGKENIIFAIKED